MDVRLEAAGYLLHETYERPRGVPINYEETDYMCDRVLNLHQLPFNVDNFLV